VIDLSEVQSGDSSLLGVLASAVQLARRRDGTVRVVTSDDHLRLKIEITGLSQTLDVFPTLADAIEGRS
jgi:anti-anti-sigma factor